jgi:hypothetical protein
MALVIVLASHLPYAGGLLGRIRIRNRNMLQILADPVPQQLP